MSIKRSFLRIMMLMLLLVATTSAQEDTTCPAIVDTALAAVESLCDETGRNQACYGNKMLFVGAKSGVDDLVFETPGDIVNVADVQSLALSPMDEESGEWGISLMKIQANLPDTLPGQNVTVLLFGDVEIENVVGETDDYTPMQAFYFRSGVGDSPCVEAPESGILIQTPKGQGQIALRVNDVDIALGSTAFLQAVPDDALYVNLLEGQATVTAFDETQTVSAGMVVSVPLDENLSASGPPNEPYAAEAIETLSSVLKLLPEAVTSSESDVETVVEESDNCTVTAGGNVNLRSGPGTVYGRAGGLAANESVTPTGQATSSDGYVWWQLASGNWVRSDVVSTAGDCTGLPDVASIPPVPTPVPTDSAGSRPVSDLSSVFEITSCQNDGGAVIQSGQPITMAHSIGSYVTAADAEAAIPTTTAWATLNGVSGTFTGFGRLYVGRDGYAYDAIFQFDPLPPGTYEAVSVSNRAGSVPDINGFDGPQETWWNCTVTVQ